MCGHALELIELSRELGILCLERHHKRLGAASAPPLALQRFGESAVGLAIGGGRPKPFVLGPHGPELTFSHRGPFGDSPGRRLQLCGMRRIGRTSRRRLA